MKTFTLSSLALAFALSACSDKPPISENPSTTNTPPVSSTPKDSPLSNPSSDVTAFAPVKSTVATIEPEKLPSDVFALVNDKAITDAVIEAKISSFMSEIPPEQVTFARYQIGQRMVMEELVKQSIESGQLVVSKSDLATCKSTFMKELEENSMSLEKLMDMNKISAKDFDLQMIVKAYIDSMITASMKDEAYATIKDQIKEGRMVSIVHKGGPASKPEDKPGFRMTLEEVRSKAAAGEAFVDLALKYSDDPNVKDNKGKCPPLFRESQMYPEIIEAAFSLEKIGDISPVVETAQGCHLLKLDSILRPDRGEAHIERILMQQCGGKLMQEFMKKLHENSTVVVRKPPQPPEGDGPPGMNPGQNPR